MALTIPGNPLSLPSFASTLKAANAPFKRPAQPLVPSFAVKLNGKALANDIALWIVGVSIEDSLDAPSMFELQLISKEDEQGTQAWTDDPRLALGAEVELSMGYGAELSRLIVGDIISIEPTFTIGGPPTLIVRGYDRRNRLNGARRSRPFPTLTDAAIAQQVCQELNVTVLATDNAVQHEQVVQEGQTDWEFLFNRAQAVGYELVIDASDGRTILLRPIANGGSVIATLTLNDDLMEFHPRFALQPVRQVQLRGWDSKTKQPINVSAGAESVPPMEGNFLSFQKAVEAIFGKAIETVVLPVTSVAEANAIAAGVVNKATLSIITGTGTARGRPDIRAGTVIGIAGLGAGFSGNYYVQSAHHRYAPRSGYLTDFQVKRNAS